MNPSEKIYWRDRMEELSDEMCFWEHLLTLEESMANLAYRLPDEISKPMAETLELLKSQLMCRFPEMKTK